MVNDSMEFYAMYKSRQVTGFEYRPSVRSNRKLPRHFGLSHAIGLLGRGLVAVGSRLERLGVPCEQMTTQELNTHA